MKANSLGLIIIAGALFFFLTKPQMADLAAIKQEKKSYEQGIADLRKVEEKKNELIAKMNSIPAEDLEKINTILPDKPNIVTLVSEIDNVASRHNISIRNINSVAQASFTNTVGEAAPQSNFNSTSLTFDFNSNYENLKAFLKDLESSLRLVDVRAISFNSSDKGGLYNYKLSLDIYWLAMPVKEAVISP